MRSGIAAAAALAVVAGLSGPAAAPAASVVACNASVYPNGPVFVTSARTMTCRAAKREQARYRWTGKNRFTTPGGFTCRPSGRGAIGYQIRCVRGSKAYRIEFSD